MSNRSRACESPDLQVCIWPLSPSSTVQFGSFYVQTGLICSIYSIEAQEEHVKEFRKLIQTKANIEREILSITKELQAEYSKSRDILKVVLDGRISDYDEALKQLDELKEDQDQTHVDVSQEL